MSIKAPTRLFKILAQRQNADKCENIPKWPAEGVVCIVQIIHWMVLLSKTIFFVHTFMK